MKWMVRFLLFLFALSAHAQVASSGTNLWGALSFLEGTWEAKATGNGGVRAVGTYTFVPELRDHVLARHGNLSECKGPSSYDCEHGDLLYIYREAPAQPLKAIFFDNEGHVIHYDVSTPTPSTAVFLSESSQLMPQFRLTYELKGQVMFGKFQMRMPGQREWRSYLEWSGAKHK
ncbi:MAG TPA: hypothetical protein VK596_11515 [Edaphobacter sp.]|nr:hypothetical protein [Edaphobacter sp.]